MYLILEGIDTAGKSTQLDILKEKYQDAIFTKEPGGTNVGAKIREMVLSGEAKSKVAEMLLFLADRAEHTEMVIKPNLNKMIISDRGFVSGIAYAKDFDIDMVKKLNKIALDGVYPDKLIMLELEPKELKNRLDNKVIDGIESRGIDYLLDIQSRMKRVINELDIDSLIINANEPIVQIANKIEEFISA